jgi:hypothetical protein
MVSVPSSMIASRLLAPLGVANSARGVGLPFCRRCRTIPKTRAHIALAWLIY